MKICEKCDSQVHAKKLCIKHYQAKHYQDNRLSSPRKVMTIDERKEAHIIAARKWREANPEKQRINVAKTRANNLDEYRRKSRESMREKLKDPIYKEQNRIKTIKWREEYPNKAIASSHSYYDKNSELIKEKNKEYRLNNIEQYRQYSRDYKALKRTSGRRLSKGLIDKMFENQNGKCNVCNIDLEISGKHIDHIVPVSKGGLHCDENVQLLCPTCNKQKSNKHFDTFLALKANLK